MKPIKFGTLAVATALTLGMFGVKAAPLPTTTDYAKMSVALTIKAQTNSVFKAPATYTYRVTTMKIGNKELLKLLAKMFEKTNWPAGAQLEYDFNSDQVIVADKTDTNILYYCGTGIDNGTNYAYLYFDPFNHEGPYKEKAVDAAPGSNSGIEYYKGEFELYYESIVDETTYASFYYGYGQSNYKWSEKWNANSIGTRSVKDSFTPVANGSVDGGVTAQITGKITLKGKVPLAL